MKTGYWKRYNQLLQKFSAKMLYKLVLSFAEKLGNPYPIKKKGRKPKLQPYEYAAYMAYRTLIKGAPFRTMEFESELYTDKHIDHATFVVNFEKIPVEYYITLVEDAGDYLDRILEYSDQYVVDSTTITTPLTFITEIKGKAVKEKIEYRSHAIVSIHPKENCICIRTALPTTKHIADCEAAKRMLGKSRIKRITLHGDMGYDYERVYEACYKNDIKPNIRPQNYTSKQDVFRVIGITEYDDEQRKKFRGIIESVFGGLTNAGLLITRLKKGTKILAYGAIVLLRQNIMSIARKLSLFIELLTKLGGNPYLVERQWRNF